MHLETLNCNNCGASLSVSEEANFVTCNHCSTQLAIRRTESTTFTQKLDQIESKQEEMQDTLNRLEQQNKLAQVDRDWERERESFMITDKHGRRHLPNEVMSVFGGVVVIVFGVFWTIMAARIGGGPFVIFGVVFILFGVGVSFFQFQKAKDYRAAQRRYHRHRRQVIRDNVSNR
jgi:Flp pilus assembly protein TadB